MPVISQVDLVNSVWNGLRTRLESEKARIYEEIGNYPPPIAACDQQFNYLIEQQTRISGELARLNEAAAKSLMAGDPGQLIDEFIRSSSYVDAETAQTIRSSLKAGLS
jgi:hypothetical protein